MLGKKAKGVSSANTILIVLAVILIAFAGLLYFNIGTPGQATIAPVQKALTETGVQDVTAIVSCPSDGTTDGQVRFEDTLASSITYDASPTCYFVPKTAGLERVTAGSLSASAFSTAADLKCTESGTKWRAVCVTTQDDKSSSDEGIDFVAEGSAVKRTLKGKNFEILQFKVEDKYTGGSTFFNGSLCPDRSDGDADHGIGTYMAMNGTQCSLINTGANTALTIGTDGYIDAKIYLKTNNTKKQFGEDGLRTWMLVDANSDEMDEPIVFRDGGDKLTNQVTSMYNDDIRKYSGYEYAYDIGSIGDRESVIDFYMQSAAGVNPSTDPIVEFCAEGRYNSEKTTDSILIGCWTDAATQAEVATAYRQYFKFDIS